MGGDETKNELEVQPKNKNNGVNDCCEFINVHATNGVAINSLFL